MNNSLRVISSLLGLLLCSSLEAAYFEPTRRLVLNEIISLATPQVTYPVYLSDAGRYYGELYLHSDDTNHQPKHNEALAISLSIDFSRKGKVFRSENFDLVFAPGELSQTLFWVRAPWDLPQRKSFDVQIRLNHADPALADRYQALRIQMTRKFDFAPLLY